MDRNTVALFQSHNSDDWGTPDDLYAELDREFHFNYDPCPLHASFDGRLTPWIGNVFVNPPYSDVIGFLKKAQRELESGNAKIIVFLVFANTDTAWFHDYIYGKAELRFLRGRLKFKGAANNSAMRPSMLAIFRGK